MNKKILDSLSNLFERDLNKLKFEIQSYSNESDLWIVKQDIKNSAGNLCLHLIGNLNHFIGTNLGKTSYKRNRHGEFHDKNVPREEMLQRINDTMQILNSVLNSIDDEEFQDVFPEKVFGYEMTTAYFLLHLYGHFNYHLGQINYHRRLLS